MDRLEEIKNLGNCRHCEGNGLLWADGKAHLPSYQGATILCGDCGGLGKESLTDDMREWLITEVESLRREVAKHKGEILEHGTEYCPYCRQEEEVESLRQQLAFKDEMRKALKQIKDLSSSAQEYCHCPEIWQLAKALIKE